MSLRLGKNYLTSIEKKYVELSKIYMFQEYLQYFNFIGKRINKTKKVCCNKLKSFGIPKESKVKVKSQFIEEMKYIKYMYTLDKGLISKTCKEFALVTTKQK